MMRPHAAAYPRKASLWNGSISYRVKQVIVMDGGLPVAGSARFGYHRSVESHRHGSGLSRIAAAIADAARARMLGALLDGHARTSTELAVLAGVSPSTASAHLARLREQRLVETLAQGKHRYHRLAGRGAARALEALMVVAEEPRPPFSPTTPPRLRQARTCYDHMAGEVAVLLHDRLGERGWIAARRKAGNAYDLTAEGEKTLAALGIDVAGLRRRRRKLAYPCVDWSERRPHLGGALGAALLDLALRRRWVVRDLDSRILSVTRLGKRDLRALFGIPV